MQTTQRKKPHKLLKLEAILRRLRKTSPNYPYFQELHRKLSAGFQGELRVDRLWQEMNLTFPHQIFYDYCFINNSGFTHQIDTLFVTPHFLCLIEIKNILGKLDFDDVKRQCIRTTSDGKIDSLISSRSTISASKLFPNIIKATKYRATNCEGDRNCKSFYHNWSIKHRMSNYA